MKAATGSTLSVPGWLWPLENSKCGGRDAASLCIVQQYIHMQYREPRIERGGVSVAIGSAVRRLDSVVIRSTFGVCMRALDLGGVRAL